MDRSDLVNTDQTVRAAIAGDEPAFAALTERHRRELHVHCYRMLASFDEAEDAVQETFLKAWRGRSGFDGGSQFRGWLYGIATDVAVHRGARTVRRGGRRRDRRPGHPGDHAAGAVALRRAGRDQAAHGQRGLDG